MMNSISLSEKPTRLQAVSRAMHAVETVAAGGPGGSTSQEVAAELGVPVPTAYHLLNTLSDEHMLQKDEDRHYRLGPLVGVLAEGFRSELLPTAELSERLRGLAGSSGETAYLSGWRYGEIVVLDCAEGSRAVRVADLRPGYKDFAHARASGRLMLALAPGSVREEYLSRHLLDRVNEKTIVSRPELDRDLASIRRRGHATEEGEFREGVACVAAPVVRGEEARLAFALSVPIARFEADRELYVTAVTEAAAAAGAPS
jgi:IclR family acetate operon transcriptional repressor